MKEFNLRLEVDVKVRAATFLSAASMLESEGYQIASNCAEKEGVESINVENVHVAKKKPRKGGDDVPVSDTRVKG